MALYMDSHFHSLYPPKIEMVASVCTTAQLLPFRMYVQPGPHDSQAASTQHINAYQLSGVKDLYVQAVASKEEPIPTA